MSADPSADAVRATADPAPIYTSTRVPPEADLDDAPVVPWTRTPE